MTGPTRSITVNAPACAPVRGPRLAYSDRQPRRHPDGLGLPRIAPVRSIRSITTTPGAMPIARNLTEISP